MLIEVKRSWFTSHSTGSKVYLDGVFSCFGLEPPTRDDSVKPRAIPDGTYEVKLLWSPSHKRIVPHVLNVPGFDAIEIHIGNFPQDTKGCLLVGDGCGLNYVSESKQAFDRFFAQLEAVVAKGETLQIIYSKAVQ